VGYKEASKFISRIVLGSILAIFVGPKLDEVFHVGPLFTIGLLLYVIVGSLILLIKEINNGTKA
jgi:F0F1-type ATP synthase assembly protein I